MAGRWALGEPVGRRAQIPAYRIMPEADLLVIAPVRIEPGWLDRRRVRLLCDGCGEGINYEREVRVGARTLCRSCSGEGYYSVPMVTDDVPTERWP